MPSRVVRSLIGSSIAMATAFASGPVSAQPAEPVPPGRTQAAPPSGAQSEQAPGEVGGRESAPDEQAPPAPAPGSGEQTPKRKVPDYDGRGDPPTTAGDVALWIPRILLSPLYLVSEYVIRRPLGWLITTAERNQWPSAIRNLFLFGPEKKAGVVPTAFLDLGFRASVGIYAFWDDLLGKDNHLRLHISTFGLDWLQGAIADKIPIGKDTSLDLRLEGVHRPDQIFHGLGPESPSQRLRYGIDRVVGRPVFEMFWWKGSRITTEAGAKYVNFREDACCGNESLTQAISEGQVPPPPGYERGYTAVYQRGEVTLDTRDPRPESQTGFRMELEMEQGSNVRQSRSNWIRYGGSVGGFLDLKNNRTVSLALTTLFVDPISGGGEIPFTEQIILGGSGPMRGYLYGRLIDRSAAVATLKYRWPIWVFLDGTMQFAMGNVYGPQLEDFKTKLLRMSSAIGIESIGGADHTFEVLVGFGTEPIVQGLDVSSFRFLFGTNRGF
jgi:surface antigen Omp85-like protein